MLNGMTIQNRGAVFRETIILIALFRVGRNVLSDQTTSTSRNPLSIGVLYDVRSVHLRPFLEKQLAERNRERDVHLVPHASVVDITDSFAVSNAMCDLITKDVIAIIGVTNASSLSTIQSYSSTFHMPFITIGSTQSFITNSGFQLFISPSYMGAVVDMLHHYGCRKAVYIYDSDEGLMRIQDLFQSLNTRDLVIDLDVRRVSSLGVAKEVLGTLLSADAMMQGQRHHKVFTVMDLEHLSILDIIRVLEKEQSMQRVELNIIAVALDLIPISAKNIDLSATNITGFQLAAHTSVDTVITVEGPMFTEAMKSTEALLLDTLEVLYLAVETGEKHEPGWLDKRKHRGAASHVKCTNFVVDKTSHGSLFMDYLKQVQFEGYTGIINFDENGKRSNFSLDVFESMHGDPSKKIGTWFAEEGLHLQLNSYIERTVILLINNTRPMHLVDFS